MTNKATVTKKKSRPKSRTASKDAVSTSCLVKAKSTAATLVPEAAGSVGSVGVPVLATVIVVGPLEKKEV